MKKHLLLALLFATTIATTTLTTSCSLSDLFKQTDTALEEKRTSAISDVQNYAKQEDYRSKEWVDITSDIAQAKEDIKNAKSSEEIDTILNSFKTKVDEYLTDAEYIYNETQEFITYQNSAKTSLENYITYSNYTGENLTQLTSILNEGKTKIEEATTKEAVDGVVSTYKAKIDEVETDAEIADKELKEYKTTKTSEVESYVNTDDYKEAQVYEINNIIDAFKSSLKDCNSKTDVDTLVENTKTSLSSVKKASEIQEEQETYPVSLYYDGYYNNLVSWTDGEDLKAQLHAIISAPYDETTGKGYRAISYGGNWDSNKAADQSLTDASYIDQLYNSNDILKDYSYSNTRTTGYQREHAFCASLMCGSLTGDAVNTKGRATDFHNLFAAFGPGNGSRRNKCLGNATDDGLDVTSTSTYAGTDYKYTTQTFEPADNDKGKLARAIFYMTVMYTEDVYDEYTKTTMKGLSIVDGNVDYSSNADTTKVNGCYTSGNTQYTAYAHGNKSDLLEWAKNSVTYSEYQHNQSVYSHISEVDGYAQGNRNPFVDYPDLVDYVYGDKSNQPGKLEDLKPSYVSLNLNKSGTKFLSLGENTVHEYEVGDSFSTNNIELYGVDKNFEFKRITDFTVSGVSEGEILSTIGSKDITITSGELLLTYTINIVKVDVFEASTYKWVYDSTNDLDKFKTSESKSGVTQNLSLNGQSWNVTYTCSNYVASGSGATFGNNTLGLKCGTSKSAISNLTIESDGVFSYGAQSTLKSISIKGATASGKTIPITIYINGIKYGTYSITRVSGDSEPLKTVTCTLPDNTTGKIKIVIENNNAASFYLYGIAVNAR